jgi:hypothetical protein
MLYNDEQLSEILLRQQEYKNDDIDNLLNEITNKEGGNNNGKESF